MTVTHPAATPGFWHQRWEAGQIGFHEGKPNLHLERYAGVLGEGTQVLVPLCGKAVDLAWLAARGHEVVGVELSPVAGEAFFAERGWTPERRREGPFLARRAGGVTILEGDVFGLDGEYAAAWDRAALIALPAEVRARYAPNLRARVRGPILVVTFVYDQARRDGPPFSVGADEVRALYPGAEQLDEARVVEERWKEVGEVTEAVWRVPPR